MREDKTIFTDNFSAGLPAGLPAIYRTGPMPLFQNLLYSSQLSARQAERAEMALVQHPVSGFVFNRLFDPGNLKYDENYNNEQGFSDTFRHHLEEVFSIFSEVFPAPQKVVEIGAGKGAFWKLLSDGGYDCAGFDPAYEGDDPRIRKEFFTEHTAPLYTDVIVMRHTLEHILHPFTFLHSIAAANHYKGHIFIEVPTLDWIMAKNAFWDIFYEHVNYFTTQTLQLMFEESTCKTVFGGQYILLWADLGKLRTIIPDLSPVSIDLSSLQSSVEEWKQRIRAYNTPVIWGVGGKGSTFLNIIDREAKIVRYAIDINPDKQGKYLGGTGHGIFSPEHLHEIPASHIIVMNENYLEEIASLVRGYPVQLCCL